MSRRRVFFYVQHLLGIGHLRRAATIISGLVSNSISLWFPFRFTLRAPP